MAATDLMTAVQVTRLPFGERSFARPSFETWLRVVPLRLTVNGPAPADLLLVQLNLSSAGFPVGNVAARSSPDTR